MNRQADASLAAFHRAASSSPAPAADWPASRWRTCCRRTATALRRSADPLAPKQPHHPPKAKSVIWLFMEGGPSHIDLFDPKPKLDELAGQPLPASFGKPITAMGTGSNTLMPSKRTFKQYGQSGIWVSDWYPNIAEHVDDMSVIRSCWADGLNHVGSVCQMNTGSILAGRPSHGRLGDLRAGQRESQSARRSSCCSTTRSRIGGPKNWSAGFLPATYQGTQFRQGDTPILQPEAAGGHRRDQQQRSKLDLLKRAERALRAPTSRTTRNSTRASQSYELAYQMQSRGARRPWI